MNEMIKLILSLSLSGSIIALAIFAMKPLIKHRLSKRIQYGIWIVVILRLIIPFSFEGSIMNQVFYSSNAQLEVNGDRNVNAGESVNANVSANTNASNKTNIGKNVDTNGNINTSKNSKLSTTEEPKASDSTIIPGIKQNVANGVINNATDYNRSFIDLSNQYAIYLWLFGLIITLIVNLIGYLRFLAYLKPANIPATDAEKEVLDSLLDGKYNVSLVRNSLITTPMLIGMKRPYILIPDTVYNQNQLKNILMHELTHLKRCDIGIKWLTLIATAAHWFNPLMYFVRNEINHACELACDEAVIKDLNKSGKQAYGDTLISVVAETRYPRAGLKATMYEEKKTLRERLISIMNHSKKSKPIILLSLILLCSAIIASIALGASVTAKNDKPPKIYITAQEANVHIYFSYGEIKTIAGITGSYEWKYLGRNNIVKAPSPLNFKYNQEHILYTTTKEQIVIGTQENSSDKKYAFGIDQINVYKQGKSISLNMLEPSYVDGNLYLQLPKEDGEYIYDLKLNFKDKGIVNYGFIVRVNMANLSAIVKHKTKYIGNNSKVAALAGLIPTPNKYFFQRYISLKTSKRPYKLNVYYETKADNPYIGAWPILGANSNTNANTSIRINTNANTNSLTKDSFYLKLQKNALVLFSMIDNLDVLSFDFRNSSSGKDSNLEMSKYVTAATFQRSDFEKKYGDLKALGENLNLLQQALK